VRVGLTLEAIREAGPNREKVMAYLGKK